MPPAALATCRRQRFQNGGWSGRARSSGPRRVRHARARLDGCHALRGGPARIAVGFSVCEERQGMGKIVLLVWVAIIVLGLAMSASRRRRAAKRRR